MVGRSIRCIDLLIEYGEHISVSCTQVYTPVPTTSTVTLEPTIKADDDVSVRVQVAFINEPEHDTVY